MSESHVRQKFRHADLQRKAEIMKPNGLSASGNK